MTELIGNWLMNSVGCNIRCTPETLGQACFDGKLFAEILVVYNVCSADYLKLIDETTRPETALSNLKKLCVWFKLLGIQITDEFLNEIVNKSGSACLKLLYELFIRLENRESTYFMDSKKKARLLSESTDRFNVVPAPEELLVPEEIDEKQYLLDILNGLRGKITSAQQATLKRFIVDCRKRHATRIRKEILKDEQCTPGLIVKPCEEFEAKAKINEFETFLASSEEVDKMKTEYIPNMSPKEYISCLRIKKRKLEADKKLKQEMGMMAMKDAWSIMVTNQENELKNILAKKLLKQSEYEKQMTLRLKRMRERYKTFIDNRNMIKDIADKQETINQFKNAFSTIKDSERISVEKQRVKELHRRLFKEKRRLKRLDDFKACRTIVEDIVDYAMIRHDYLTLNGIPIPKNKVTELKLLFVKGVKLLLREMKQRAKDPLEPPIVLDDVRIREFSDIEFHLYMYRVGPWYISKQPEDEHENLNITGFIVHRLLDLKYDFNLSIGKQADLPNFEYKILLHRINNTMAIEKLKYYLSNFKIEVVDVFTVINYYLNAYKTYLGVDTLIQRSEALTPLKSRGFLQPLSKEKKGKKKSKMLGRNGDRLDKGHQFPSNEEVNRQKIMSEAANKGKYVYEFLQEGGLLPDGLICSLIIDYLKTLKDVNGWVLVNYPDNITQIAMLEYMLTGLEVPFMPKVTENMRRLIDTQLESVFNRTGLKDDPISEPLEENDHNHEEEQTESGSYSIEELMKLKNSNILPKPNLPSLPPEFHSFFTKVIVLHYEPDTKKYAKKASSAIHAKVDEGENDDNKLTLESFYQSLGISSNFAYKNFDFGTSKKLLRFVLSVSSSQQQDFYRNIDKGFDTKVKPVEKSEEKRNIDKPVTISTPEMDDWIKQMYNLQKGEESAEETVGEEGLEEDICIYPGHVDWDYTQFPISEMYANILATIWESMEYFYIYNLKECFGLLRTVESRLMPYRNYIRKKANQCLNLEDDRTKLVTNFQLMLNNIENHHRSVDTIKNEIHYRLLKMQCVLWKLTDVKKFYCDQVLALIKSQDWILSYSINFLKVYAFFLQVEADRFVETMQLIEDYYSVCLLGYAVDDRLKKLIFPKIGLKMDKSDEPLDKMNKPHFPVSTGSNASRKTRSSLLAKSKKDLKNFKSQEDITKRILWDPFNDLKISLYYSDYVKEKNPVLLMLYILISKLKKAVIQMRNLCLSRSESIIGDFKDLARVVADQSTKMSLKSIGNDIEKVTLEWDFAMENETQRILYRISLIEKRAMSDLMEDIYIIENTFKDFERDITSLYHRQIVNTDKLCDLMRAAIEEETAVQPLVLLNTDSLTIDQSVILYPDAPPPPPPSLREEPVECQFSITQLTNFYFKMINVAPFGIVERSFIQILEDMVYMGHQTGHCYLPQVWSHLSRDQIKDIVHRLFGSKTILDWRLFIIFALDLGYPTVETILEMRQNFRRLDTNLTETVSYEEYCCVFLWFERNESLTIGQDLYHAKAKELLFKIFQISEDLMNYTEFLLAFCRDRCPTEGFVKALALVEGCATVAWKQDLFRETLQIEKENEKYNIAYGILTIVMAGVFGIVDNVIITEVVDSDHDLPEDVPKNLRNNSMVEAKRRSTIGKHRTQTKKSNRPSINAESSKSPDTNEVSHHQVDETREITPELSKEDQKPHILWKSDVYFSAVFSLLLLDIHNFSLLSDQIYEPLDMEESLRKIFVEKGKGDSIKLFSLLSDSYVRDLFSKYRCYEATCLTNLVAMFLDCII